MALCINLTGPNNQIVRLRFAEDVGIADMIDIISKFGSDLTSLLINRKYTDIESLISTFNKNLKNLNLPSNSIVYLEDINGNLLDTINKNEVISALNSGEVPLMEETDVDKDISSDEISDISPDEEVYFTLSNYISKDVNYLIGIIDGLNLPKSSKDILKRNIESLNIVVEEGLKDESGREVEASYNRSTDTIKINKKYYENEESRNRLLLHELLHRATGLALRFETQVDKSDEDFSSEEYEKYKEKLNKLKEIIPEIYKYRNEIILRAQLTDKNLEKKIRSLLPKDQSDFGLKELEELFIRAITEKDVAELLQSISVSQDSGTTYQEENSLWHRIIKAILEFLNIDVSDTHTVFNLVVDPVVNVLDYNGFDPVLDITSNEKDVYSEDFSEEEISDKLKRIWEQYEKDVSIKDKNGQIITDEYGRIIKDFDQVYFERIDRPEIEDLSNLSRYEKLQLARFDYAISELQEGDLVLVPKLTKSEDSDEWYYEYEENGNVKKQSAKKPIVPGRRYKTMYLPVVFNTTPYYPTVAVATPQSKNGDVTKVAVVRKSNILGIRKRDNANLASGKNIKEFEKLAKIELKKFRESRSKFYTKDENGNYVKRWNSIEELKTLLREHPYTTIRSLERQIPHDMVSEGDIVTIKFKKWNKTTKQWEDKEDSVAFTARVNFKVGGKIHVTAYNPNNDPECRSFLVDPEDLIEIHKSKEGLLSEEELTKIERLSGNSDWDIVSVKGNNELGEDEYIEYRSSVDDNFKNLPLKAQKEQYQKYLENREFREIHGINTIKSLVKGDAVLIPFTMEENGVTVNKAKWRQVLFSSESGVYVAEIDSDGNFYPKYYSRSSIKHVAFNRKDAKNIYEQHIEHEALLEEDRKKEYRKQKYGNSYYIIPVTIDEYTGDNYEQIRVQRESYMTYIKLLKPGDVVLRKYYVNGEERTINSVVYDVKDGVVRTISKAEVRGKEKVFLTNVTIEEIAAIKYKSENHPLYKSKAKSKVNPRQDIISLFEKKSQSFFDKIFTKKVFVHTKDFDWEETLKRGYKVETAQDARNLFEGEDENVLFTSYDPKGKRPKYKVEENKKDGSFVVYALTPEGEIETDGKGKPVIVFSSKDVQEGRKYVRVRVISSKKEDYDGKIVIDSGKVRAFDIRYLYDKNGRLKDDSEELFNSVRPGELVTYRYEDNYYDAQVLSRGIARKNVDGEWIEVPIITVLMGKRDGGYFTKQLTIEDVVAIGKFRVKPNKDGTTEYSKIFNAEQEPLSNVDENIIETQPDSRKIEEVKSWILSVMPEANIELVEDLIDGIAKGSYDSVNDLITLSEKYANKQTAKHEIFHAAFSRLPKEKQEELLNEGSELFGIQRRNQEDDLAIEEKIAEMMENTPDEEIPITKLGKWIQSVRNFFRNLFREKTKIERFLRDVNQGRIGKKVQQNTGIRYQKEENVKPKYYLSDEESIKTKIDLPRVPEQKVDLKINQELLSLIEPVLKELNDMGKNTLIVGGSVRDALLGNKPKDIDVEVYNITIEDLIKVLSKYGKVDEVGKSFGVLKFIPFKQTKSEISNALTKTTELVIKSIAQREGKSLKELEESIAFESTERIKREEIREILNLIFDFDSTTQGVEIEEILNQEQEYKVQPKYIKNLGLKENDYWLSKLLDREPDFLRTSRITVNGQKLSMRDSIVYKVQTEYQNLIDNIETSPYIISQITDSYLDFNATVAENNGNFQLAEQIRGPQREEIRQIILEEERKAQISDLRRWIDFLENSDFPVEFKYYILKEVLTKNVKEIDKNKNKVKFVERTSTTVRTFQSLNEEVLIQTFNDEKSNNSPLASYAIKMKQFSESNLPMERKYKETDKGIWFKFVKGDAGILSSFVQDTNWCTSGYSVAEKQLEAGDFYVFHPFDEKENEKIAIRMSGGKIAELRGTQEGQDLKDSSVKIAEEFIKTELPGNERQIKKLKYLKLRQKYKEDESVRDDYNFLNELVEYSFYNDSYTTDPIIYEAASKLRYLKLINTINEKRNTSYNFKDIKFLFDERGFVVFSIADEIFTILKVHDPHLEDTVANILRYDIDQLFKANVRYIDDEIKENIKSYFEESKKNKNIIVSHLEYYVYFTTNTTNNSLSIRFDIPKLKYIPLDFFLDELKPDIIKNKLLDLVNNSKITEIDIREYDNFYDNTSFNIEDVEKIVEKQGLDPSFLEKFSIFRFISISDIENDKKRLSYETKTSKSIFTGFSFEEIKKLKGFILTNFEINVGETSDLSFENVQKIKTFLSNNDIIKVNVFITLDKTNINLLIDKLYLLISVFDKVNQNTLVNINLEPLDFDDFNIEKVKEYLSLINEFINTHKNVTISYSPISEYSDESDEDYDTEAEDYSYDKKEFDKLVLFSNGIIRILKTYDEFLIYIRNGEVLQISHVHETPDENYTNILSIEEAKEFISKFLNPLPISSSYEENERIEERFKETLSEVKDVPIKLPFEYLNFTEDSFEQEFEELQLGKRKKYRSYKQEVNNKIKGQLIRTSNNKALILLHKNADVTTVLHELAHLWEAHLTDEERQDVLKWTGHKQWTRETSEKFAKGFEQYTYEGIKTGIESIDRLFEKFASWLRKLIDNFKEYFGISELNPEIKSIYNRMLIEGIGLNEELSEDYRVNLEELYKDYLDGNLELTKELVEIEEPFDFSVPRRENKVGAGYKGFKVELSDDISIQEAASRRDFTWNSMGYNPITKTLYDYYGGIDDLANGIIRHTSEKFAEDPLRILRAMQFQARMGHVIAPETYELMKSLVEKGEFDHLVTDETYQEWLKEKTLITQNKQQEEKNITAEELEKRLNTIEEFAKTLEQRFKVKTKVITEDEAKKIIADKHDVLLSKTGKPVYSKKYNSFEDLRETIEDKKESIREESKTPIVNPLEDLAKSLDVLIEEVEGENYLLYLNPFTRILFVNTDFEITKDIVEEFKDFLFKRFNVSNEKELSELLDEFNSDLFDKFIAHKRSYTLENFYGDAIKDTIEYIKVEYPFTNKSLIKFLEKIKHKSYIDIQNIEKILKNPYNFIIHEKSDRYKFYKHDIIKITDILEDKISFEDLEQTDFDEAYIIYDTLEDLFPNLDKSDILIVLDLYRISRKLSNGIVDLKQKYLKTLKELRDLYNNIKYKYTSTNKKRYESLEEYEERVQKTIIELTKEISLLNKLLKRIDPRLKADFSTQSLKYWNGDYSTDFKIGIFLDISNEKYNIPSEENTPLKEIEVSELIKLLLNEELSKYGESFLDILRKDNKVFYKLTKNKEIIEESLNEITKQINEIFEKYILNEDEIKGFFKDLSYVDLGGKEVIHITGAYNKRDTENIIEYWTDNFRKGLSLMESATTVNLDENKAQIRKYKEKGSVMVIFNDTAGYYFYSSSDNDSVSVDIERSSFKNFKYNQRSKILTDPKKISESVKRRDNLEHHDEWLIQLNPGTIKTIHVYDSSIPDYIRNFHDEFGVRIERYEISYNEYGEKITTLEEVLPKKVVNKFYQDKQNPKGFYDFKEKVAYLIKDRADYTTTVHEAFTHPFLIAIEQNNKELFDNLFKEASKHEEIVRFVKENYGDLSEKEYKHELIAHAIDKFVREELDEIKHKGLIERIKEFFKELSDTLKKILNVRNLQVKDIDPKTTLKDLAQYTIYGKGTIQLGVDTTSSISRERVREEWIKWAQKGKYHSKIFDFLRKSGLGDKLYPELMKLISTPQDPQFHPEGDVEEHTKQVLAKAQEIAVREKLSPEEKQILIFSALFHDIAKPETTKEEWSEKLGRFKITAKGHEPAGEPKSKEIMTRMGIPKKTQEIIGRIIGEHLAHATISSITSDKSKLSAFSKLMNRISPATIQQLMFLMEADMLGRNNANSDKPASISEFEDLLKTYLQINKSSKAEPLIKGNDLIQRGIKPGKQVGEILKHAYEAQLNLEFLNREEALNWLDQYLSGNKTVVVEKQKVESEENLLSSKTDNRKPDQRANILKPSDPQPSYGLILTIGITGSGKSTWASNLTNKTIISIDDIREELTGNILDTSKNEQVFNIAKSRAIEALKNGKLVVIDSTNLNTKLRNDMISEIEKEIGRQLPIFYKIMPSDPELSKNRIRKDALSGKIKKVIPNNVIETQYQQYLKTLSDIGIEPPKPIKQIEIKYNPDPNHPAYKTIVMNFLEILGSKIGSVDIGVVKNDINQLYQTKGGSIVINEKYPMKDVKVQQLVIPILDKAGLATPDLSPLSIFEEYTDNRDEQLVLLSSVIENIEQYDENVQNIVNEIIKEYKKVYQELMDFNWDGTVFEAVKDNPVFANSVSELTVDITLDEDKLRDLEIIKEIKCLKR